MARTLNQHTIIGYIAKDPVIKPATESTKAFTAFTVITDESWKDKQSGEFHKITESHNVTVFGKNAENAAEMVAKGRKIWVQGPVLTRKREAEGQTYYNKIITNPQWILLDNKPGEEPAPQAEPAPAAQHSDADIPA